MFGSQPPPKPHKPYQRHHKKQPDPDDRYAPASAIKIHLHDTEGKPVTVYLTPRAARQLAHEIFKALHRPADDGGEQ